MNKTEVITDLSKRGCIALCASHKWLEVRQALVLSLTSSIVLIPYIHILFFPVLALRFSPHVLCHSLLCTSVSSLRSYL